MFRTAMPAILLAGSLLLPGAPAGATPICVTVTVTVDGTTVPIGPICVPFDGPATCGEKAVAITPPLVIGVLVTYCVPNL